MKFYTVRRGDCIRDIARRFGCSCQEILRINQLANPAALAIGQALMLPSSPQPVRSIIVNGYLSRYDRETVEKTFPYLSFHSPFAYRADANGDLHALCAAPALSSGSAPPELLTITNQTSDGVFSPRIAHAVLCDEKVQYRFLQSIAARLAQSQLYGVNLNFTFLHSFDRDAYTRFFARLSAFVHSLGALVVTALPPQGENAPTDPLSAAFDYKEIGACADYVILLSYDWGHRRSPPGAIAPIGKVRTLLSYATGQIPPEKLLLSVPNYALDWILPFCHGQNARLLTHPQALDLAATVGAEIRFCESSRAPTFDFYDSTGKYHRVWFEDVRSLDEKYALVSTYGLAGLSFWNLDHFYEANFQTLERRFSVEKLI